MGQKMGNSKSSSNIYEIPNQNINCKKGHKLTFQAENSYSSASFQCNICKHTSKSCQSSCFVCKTCKFYCCWYCNIVIDYSFKNYQKITCNANHELHPCTSVPYSGGQFECDICRKLSDPNEFCMRCDMCKYDICITCASCFGDNKFKLTKNFINYSSEVKCEKSHQLKYASTVPYESLYYICNYCTRYSNIKAAAVRCDKCKYDLCISCYYIRYKLAMGSKKLPDEVNIQNENKANISDAIASLSENKIDGFVTIDDRQKKSHNDNNNNNNNNSSNINIIKNNTIFHDVFVLNSNSNTNNKVYDNNGMNVFSSNDNPRLGHPNNNAHEKINNHKGNNNVDTNVNNVDISNVVNMNSNIVPEINSAHESLLNPIEQNLSNLSMKETTKSIQIVDPYQGVSEELLCVVCLLNKKNILFQPCNHLSCCEDCSNSIIKKDKKCPICREIICNSIKIFMS